MTMIVDVDMRSSLGPARDQGRRPTCLAFAATAAHEAWRAVDDQLSVEFLYFYGVQRSHKDPNRGLNRVSVAAALKEEGQPLEAAWPYSATTPALAGWQPPQPIASVHKASLVFSSRTVADVHALLSASTPVVLIVAVTTALYRPDADGVIMTSLSDKTTTTRHAIVAVGSGHTSAGRYLLIRNSWGLSWVTDGHGWLPESYLETNLRDTGIIKNVGAP